MMNNRKIKGLGPKSRTDKATKREPAHMVTTLHLEFTYGSTAKVKNVEIRACIFRCDQRMTTERKQSSFPFICQE